MGTIEVVDVKAIRWQRHANISNPGLKCHACNRRAAISVATLRAGDHYFKPCLCEPCGADLSADELYQKVVKG